VVVAVLAALAREQQVKEEVVADAIQRYGIDPEAVDPLHA
jgi:pyruvate dehydrogenase complex dehydrogenase (E1) component